MTATIARCTAAERRALEQKRTPTGYEGKTIKGFEPALGSLDERLSIIIRRLGGRIGPLRSNENINQYRVA